MGDRNKKGKQLLKICHKETNENWKYPFQEQGRKKLPYIG